VVSDREAGTALKDAPALPDVRSRSDDPEEPLRDYADPAGHPFCIIAVT
jgi:hypothetical protein